MIMKQKSILPLAITVAILGGLLIFGRSPKNLAMADDYHGRVEQFINAIPDVIGQWQGTDIELPPAALASRPRRSPRARSSLGSWTRRA